MTVPSQPPLHHHFLTTTTIDISTLSHSELHSLSLLHRHHFATVSSPPPTTTTTAHHRKRRRGFSLLLHRERTESSLIVSFLKQLLQVQFDDPLPRLQRSRKRPIPRVEMEIVNGNGVAVDLAALEKAEGPFAAELRRRAEGMEKEDELLEMLAGIGGDWCTWRKKRRIVDACLLGDALPVGWKVIVALRSKGGRFSPYCRHYISPTGDQLSSCKEVSSYLKSYFGINDDLLRDSRGEHHDRVEFQDSQNVELYNELCRNSEAGNSLLDVPDSTFPNTHAPTVHAKDAFALGTDNLVEIQVHDLYECHTCNMSFDVKDKYLQHLLSFHQRTTRKYRLGSALREGTIEDGKYEGRGNFQSGLVHLVRHGKESARRSQDSPVQVTPSGPDQSPNIDGISKIDALIEIAQSSIQDMGPDALEKESCNGNNGNKLCMPMNSRPKDAGLGTGKNSGSFPDEVITKKGSGEAKTLWVNLNICDKVIDLSSACPNETEMDSDRTSSEEPIPPSDKVIGLSINGEDINNSNAFAIELEMGKDSDEDESFSRESSPCDEVRERSMSDGNQIGSTACPHELEMEKGGPEDEASSEELNPHDKVCNKLTIDAETKHQTFNCSMVGAEKNSHFDGTRVKARGSSRWKSTVVENEGCVDEPEGVLNVHYPLRKETPNLDGADYANKLDLQPPQGYDDREAGNICGEGHASLNSSSPFDELLVKAGQSMCGLDQNLESVIGRDFMELDVTEPPMYQSVAGEDYTEVGKGLDASIESQSEFELEMVGRSMIQTFCVWCGVEFCHEVVGSEPQPDSVGFMCPTCRTKISKQFNELESNFSRNPNSY